jgi:DNA-binding response OmpR family regulator
MAEEPIANRTVLAVIPLVEDCTSLGRILNPTKWEVQFTSTFERARDALRAFSFGVVISEACLPDGLCWKDLLREVQNLPVGPPLIVVDRLADEWLWTEVLNLGGQDVLKKPFDAKEVLHAVTVACRFCENEQRMAALRKPVKSTSQEQT